MTRNTLAEALGIGRRALHIWEHDNAAPVAEALLLPLGDAVRLLTHWRANHKRPTYRRVEKRDFSTLLVDAEFATLNTVGTTQAEADTLPSEAAAERHRLINDWLRDLAGLLVKRVRDEEGTTNG